MSDQTIRVRGAEIDDLPQVIELERAIPEAPHWTGADYAAILRPRSTGAGRRLFVADTRDGLGGFAVGKVIAGLEGFAELESVAVRADARRGGVGRALCEAVRDWSREQGATVLELEVRAASAGAIALYERLGFERQGVRRSYYKDPADDALLMRLRLV